MKLGIKYISFIRQYAENKNHNSTIFSELLSLGMLRMKIVSALKL